MNEDELEREPIIHRGVQCSREPVWKAMTHPTHVSRRWGPDGFRNDGVKMDFRVGGAWTIEMVGRDDTRYSNHFVYKQITRPSRMDFDQGDDGQRVWFEATANQEAASRDTLITLRQRCPICESRDEVVCKYGAIEGGKQHFAKPETSVEGNLA